MNTREPLLDLIADVVERPRFVGDDITEEDAARLLEVGWVTRVRLRYGEALFPTLAGHDALKVGGVGERHAGLRPRQR